MQNFIERNRAISFLIGRKFPTVKVPGTGLSNRPLIAAFEPNAKGVLIDAEQYRQRLSAMPAEQFEALYQTERLRADREREEFLNAEEPKRFFNQPKATADFNHWSRAAHWTLDEAVALSLGKDPRVVNSASLKPLASVSEFASRYFNLRDLAQRAVAWQKLSDLVLPGIFIAWARQNELDFPEELSRLVEARGNKIGNWKSAYDALRESLAAQQAQYKRLEAAYDKMLDDNSQSIDEVSNAFNELIAQRNDLQAQVVKLKSDKANQQPVAAEIKTFSERERNNMLRVIVAIAHAKFHYKPSNTKNSAPQNIVSALERLGQKLSEDTILKFLREGAQLIDWTALDADRRS